MEKKKTTFFGLNIRRVSMLCGIAYSNVWRHAHGERKISAEMAVRYNDALGIPLSVMRPDLWPSSDNIQEKALAPSQA